MKKIFLSLSLLFISSFVFAQIKDVHGIFDKYQETEGITSIKISKPMFSLLSKLDLKDDDLKKIKPLLKNVNSLNILISGGEALLKEMVDVKPGLLKQGATPAGLQAQINDAVKGLNYEELVTVNSSGNKIKLLTVSSTGDVLHNLLLSITSEEKNVLMLLDGDVSMSEVSNFIAAQD